MVLVQPDNLRQQQEAQRDELAPRAQPTHDQPAHEAAEHEVAPRDEAQAEPAPREERRGSYRCPVQGDRRQGRLRIRLREFPVEILDESAQGFAVAADAALDCQVGDVVLAEIASAWFEARVANRNLAECEAADGESPTVARTGLGLVRLRELDAAQVDPSEAPLLSWLRFKSMLQPLVPLGRSARGTVVMIVGIVVLGAILVSVLERSAPLADALQSEAARQSDGQVLAPDMGASVEEPQSTRKRKREPERTEREAELAETAEVAKAAAAAKAESTAKVAQAVPERIARMAHPDFVLRPEVTEKLTLSPQQRERLEQLSREYEMMLKAQARSGKAAVENAEEALLRFGRRGWEILTDEQQRILTRMQLESGDAPDAAATAPEPATPADGETTAEEPGSEPSDGATAPPAGN
jgi:hypothetical protein